MRIVRRPIISVSIVFFLLSLSACNVFQSYTSAIKHVFQSESSAIKQEIEDYLQEYRLGTPIDEIRKEFPLALLTVPQLGLPVHYASYRVSLWDIAVFSEQNLIVAHYEYRKPGSIAYEITYGAEGYLYKVTIIYELEAQAACGAQAIETQRNDVHSEDGIYVLTNQAIVVPLTDYLASSCQHDMKRSTNNKLESP